MNKQLAALRKLTEMALDVERMKLQQLSQAERALAEQIRELDRKSNNRIAQLIEKGGTDAAQFAGADMLWQTWIQQQKGLLNTRRATLLAMREEQLDTTGKAFGKSEAVRRLLDKFSDEAEMKSRRL